MIEVHGGSVFACVKFQVGLIISINFWDDLWVSLS